MTKSHYILILIIVILLGSNIWWIDHSYGHKRAGDHYIQHIKDYPYLDPTLPFYDKRDLVVNIQEVRNYLKYLPEQNKDWANISIYFEALNTGANVTVNPDLKIWPASLSKLPIAMVAMKKVESGDWSFDKKFKLEERDLGYDSFITDLNKEYSLEELIYVMLHQSDNTSWRLLSRNLTIEEITQIGDAVGLDELFVNNAKVSAKDYSRLFRALHLATFLNKDNSQKLLGILVESEFNKFTKSGLPTNVKFAHKWGANKLLNVYADSGIVYTKYSPYLISVMIEAKNDQDELNEIKADKLMKEIGERTSQFMLSAT